MRPMPKVIFQFLVSEFNYFWGYYLPGDVVVRNHKRVTVRNYKINLLVYCITFEILKTNVPHFLWFLTATHKICLNPCTKNLTLWGFFVKTRNTQKTYILLRENTAWFLWDNIPFIFIRRLVSGKIVKRASF